MTETRENDLPDGSPGCVPPGPGTRRPGLSPEIVAGIVKLVDFCTVLGAALVAFTLYLALSVDALDR
jgi:hypothetical protein